MIPLRLRISGFLSYRDPVEIDFTTFDLACISGQNGAGKSSLLDSITWSLFGQARKRDDSLVNLQSKSAEVTFSFIYEKNVFRVQRIQPRGKSAILEFQIQDASPIANTLAPSDGGWKPLTERTLRETQARIEQTLRLDYETFINAAFFLQGKADQFTKQTASKRKEVLSTILGLEMWEKYKTRTSEKRKAFEDEVQGIEGGIKEIDAELAEEEPRKQRLKELEGKLKLLTVARKTQEITLENIKKSSAFQEQQQKMVETFASTLNRTSTHLNDLQTRLSEREAVKASYSDIINRSQAIESAHEAWQIIRADLAKWEQVASSFREYERERAPLLERIGVEKARLQEELRGLLIEKESAVNRQVEINNLKPEIDRMHELLSDVEGKIIERGKLELERNSAREKQAELKAENDALKIDMDEIKVRINTLDSANGSTCPLCGQSLSPEHREITLNQLQGEGKAKGDRFRANKSLTDELAVTVKFFESKIESLSSAENKRLTYSNSVAQLTEGIERLKSLSNDWETKGEKRLKELEKILNTRNYAPELQKQLSKVDKSLAKLGYDASAHDTARELELEKRTIAEEYRNLETTRSALSPLTDEIQNLKSELEHQLLEFKKQETDYKNAKASLDLMTTQAPDLAQAERALFDIQEQENGLHQEVGAARQKVNVLDSLFMRKGEYQSVHEGLSLQIGRHKTLERALGKDGVPALLIEQVLPEIETKTNELLDRLSDGQMSVRFITQVEYKDRKREDAKETLDIQISDPAGVRDYEMYSGGEAFRVNFAIRLALSEVLAQRKGARLQTLVIDEGFGSQDIQGRQRLIEAINLVKGDFAKILVITHLDELKDVFPTRIEVEKTDRGSMVTVV